MIADQEGSGDAMPQNQITESIRPPWSLERRSSAPSRCAWQVWCPRFWGPLAMAGDHRGHRTPWPAASMLFYSPRRLGTRRLWQSRPRAPTTREISSSLSPTAAAWPKRSIPSGSSTATRRRRTAPSSWLGISANRGARIISATFVAEHAGLSGVCAEKLESREWPLPCRIPWQESKI